MASAHAAIETYISIDEAARRLHVPAYCVLEVLDTYGITSALRSRLNRPVTIHSAALKDIRRILRDEHQQQGAA